MPSAKRRVVVLPFPHRLTYGSAIKTPRKPRAISELKISNRR
jgi:hypothetical protein